MSYKNTIFVIEDDSAFTFLMENEIKKITPNANILSYTSVERALNDSQLQPNIILLDHYLNQANGIDSIPHILKAIPNASIAVLSQQTEVKLLSQSYVNGAREYIRKDDKVLNHVKDFIKAEIESKKQIPSHWENIRTYWKSKSKQKPKRVVIVDDDEAQLFALEYMLSENNNAWVDTFVSLKDLIKSYEYTPDIIVLDYQLDEYNITQNDIAVLKQLYPTSKLICLSQNQNMNVALSLKSYGIDTYIQKSVEATQYLQKTVFNMAYA